MTIDTLTVKGWLTREERELLPRLSAAVPAGGLVLNIGVEFGASMACLRAGNPDVRIIGVDLDTTKCLEGGYDCELWQIDSHVLVKAWKEPLDLVFIDGDHSYSGVLQDAEFADYVKLHGCILFQDCWAWGDYSKVHDLVPGVNKAVDEWYGYHFDEFEELPSVGTTRVFRRTKHAS